MLGSGAVRAGEEAVVPFEIGGYGSSFGHDRG